MLPDSPKKILLITRNYPPMTGGMERLIHRASHILATKYDLTLIGPPGCSSYTPKNATVYEVRNSPARFNIDVLILVFRKLRKVRFDLILGGSGVVAPATSILKFTMQTPSCLFIHGLDLVADNTIYRKIFVPLITASTALIANSKFTANEAYKRGAAKDAITIIHPGVTTNILNSESLRKELKLGSNPIILYVGRIIERKGLLPFLQQCFPNLVESIPNLSLLIVGDEPAAAVKQEPGLRKKIFDLINISCWGKNVFFLGRASDETLQRAYHEADLLIFPLVPIKGDAEGFGMVAIEAAAQGTPTVAFACGGITDAIESGENGFLIEPMDYRAFTTAIKQLIGNKHIHYKHCIEHAKKFSWNEYRSRLLLIVNQIINLKDSH